MLLPYAQLILLTVIIAGQFIASSLAPGAVIVVQSLNVRLRDALTQGREDFKERTSAFFPSGIIDYITFRGNISEFVFSILLQQVQKEYEESGKGRYPKSKSRNQIIMTSEDVA